MLNGWVEGHAGLVGCEYGLCLQHVLVSATAILLTFTVTINHEPHPQHSEGSMTACGFSTKVIALFII